MQKLIKCKLVDMAEGKFDLVESLVKVDTIIYWQEFKCVGTKCNIAPLGMSLETQRIWLVSRKPTFETELKHQTNWNSKLPPWDFAM
eukprot:15367138-Ditylum_brightwellii.AAC.1